MRPASPVGFFSKESALASVLESSLAGSSLLFGAGIAVAALTVLYMLRLFLVAFLGSPRSEGAAQARESSSAIRLPLILLAAASAGAGWLPVESWLAGQALPPHEYGLLALAFSILALGFGTSLALALYRKAESDPLAARLPVLSGILRAGFCLDFAYRIAVILTHESLSRVAGLLDRRLIDGLAVRGLAGFADLSARALRLVQTGHLQTYAFLLLLGMAVLLYLAAGRLPLPAAP